MRPGRVEAGDAVAEGEPAARLHEAGVALGDGDGDAGGDQGPAAAGRERGVLAGDEVEPGVARPGVGRQRQVGVEADDGHDEAVRHRRHGRWLSHGDR